MIHFLDEVFWPLYSTTSSDIEQAELYAHLKEYEGEMRETRESQDDHQINENTLPSGSIPKIWLENRYHKLKKLGKYITSDGQKYEIAIGERRQATWYNDYRVEWKSLSPEWCEMMKVQTMMRRIVSVLAKDRTRLFQKRICG